LERTNVEAGAGIKGLVAEGEPAKFENLDGHLGKYRLGEAVWYDLGRIWAS
jgi:hypothetical protein